MKTYINETMAAVLKRSNELHEKLRAQWPAPFNIMKKHAQLHGAVLASIRGLNSLCPTDKPLTPKQQEISKRLILVLWERLEALENWLNGTN